MKIFSNFLNQNPMLLCAQVCVVESAKRGPVVSEYSVSGTTYAPEGIIFDSTGLQVLFC